MKKGKTNICIAVCCALLLCSCGYTQESTKSKQINTSGGVGKEYFADTYSGLGDCITNNFLGQEYTHVFVDLNGDGYQELFLYWTPDYKNWFTYVFSIDDQGVFLMKNDQVQQNVFVPIKNKNGEYRLAVDEDDGQISIYDFYFNKIGTEMDIELEDTVDGLKKDEWEMSTVTKGYKFEVE